MAANVESKSACNDVSLVARRAAALGARHEGMLEQEDTYFHTPDGRLKLREIVHVLPDGRTVRQAELIRYLRPDTRGSRVSRYERTEIGDPRSVKERLSAAHGLRGVVRKRRELWLLDSTRIHLDRVEGLGSFVELETVAAGVPGQSERREHDRIAALLGIDLATSLPASYIDLLEEAGATYRLDAMPGRPRPRSGRP
jgi:adenylate cyclase class IV